jgi:hypothetical protein
MKRFLLSTLSAVVSIGMAVPAFAYVTSSDDITAQTSPYHSGRPSKRVIMKSLNKDAYSRVRTAPSADDSGRSLLQRSESRRFRRLNRSPKPDSDRYRTLNTRPNTRSIRKKVEKSSFLPNALVQTGQELNYDRVSRRSIRGDRDRALLFEISQSN